MTDQHKIAICGMGGVFPGASDLTAYWQNILDQVDAVGTVPAERWPSGVVTASSAAGPLPADRAWHRRGYFITTPLLPAYWRPKLVSDSVNLDPLFALTLRVAADAFFDSVWQKIDRSRTGIIAGNILLPTAGSSRVACETFGATWLESLTGRPTAQPKTDPREAFPATRPIALAARALGLGGACYGIDAACASTLYALHFACQRLLSGEADAMIAGGVSRPDSLYTQVGFSQLGALSPSGRCRPFSAQADGLLVGEGGGMFLLKRLADAEAQGDRVYGVIAGIGLSNDLAGGLVAPSSEGQLRAMRAAYAAAGLLPDDVQFIECHATGTPLGDRVELASLAALWQTENSPRRCVLGGVKGNVGHLLTAAGAASLAKVLLALQHKTLPPTLHDGFTTPAWPGHPFELLQKPRFWAAPAGDAPRRAAVSGFGFGGINAHLILEEYQPPSVPAQARCILPTPPRPLAVVGLARVCARDDGAAGSAPGDGSALDNHRWWGAEKSHWFKKVISDGGPIAVRAISRIEVPFGRYRIPPRELAKTSPQQLVFLDAAFRALSDAELTEEDKKEGGVFVGVGLDDQANHFYCRWADSQINGTQGASRIDEDRAGQSGASLWPALDAERTIGNLGAMTASRVTREFHFGGMGLTFASEENSGVAALDAAARAIAGGQLRCALVGAVDFAASLGHAVSITRLERSESASSDPSLCFADGAMAMVVMDAARAAAEGRRIYGTIDHIRLSRQVGCGKSPQSGISFGSSHALMTVAGGLLAPASTGSAFFLHQEGRDGSLAELKMTPTGAAVGVVPQAESTKVASQQIEVAGCSFVMPSALAEDFTKRSPAPAGQLVASLRTCTKDGCGGISPEISGVGFAAGGAHRLLLDAPGAFARTRSRLADAHDTYLTHGMTALRQWHALIRDDLLLAAGSSAATAPRGAEAAAPESIMAGAPSTGRGSSFRVAAGRGAEERSCQPVGTVGNLRAKDAIPAQMPILPLVDLSGRSGATQRDEPRVTPCETTTACGGALADISMKEDAPDEAEAIARTFDYQACLEFARGAISRVLGPRFAAVDQHPTRVRLPDEPLLLCHRILLVEGEPFSLSRGRIVTEHDIRPSSFYLDDGLIPIGIAVEAGQADLFLSAFLGIDLVTRGEAKYRLLDATVTFHSRLPKAPQTIRYDIRIHEFFAQGATHLFRFGFDATVDGQPLMTMAGGVAGFFTDEQLAAGKGIARSAKEPLYPRGRWVDFTPLVAMQRESYDEHALDSLRSGDYAACFGDVFRGLGDDRSTRKTLPGGRMRLVHRIASIDPVAGRYGIGCIRGEADIHPDDWFLACHFVDDMVMPGTLMYECCFQTLRVFLMRMGWVGDRTLLAPQPLIGAASTLRCRGQVLVTTQVVTYEIHLREIGYQPDAYATADALMYADGKLIVEISNMTLTHPGLTREKAAAVWVSRQMDELSPPAAKPVASVGASFAPPPCSDVVPAARKSDTGPAVMNASSGEPTFVTAVAAHVSPDPAAIALQAGELFSADQIRAFAGGKPSLAFGEAYAKFDDPRHFVARLPMDPYLFMDRVLNVQNMTPMVMKADGMLSAVFEMKGNEWFLGAKENAQVPYCILNEIALQACGFLAAYMGSALTVRTPLYFRNLAGAARLRRPIPRNEGTITAQARCLSIVKAKDLILQRYDFQLTGEGGQAVYRGQTEFGFFSAEALSAQIGILKRSFDPAAQARGAVAGAVAALLAHPVLAETADLRMIDDIVVFDPEGGRLGLGYIKGRKRIDPAAWFFAAHFLNDPVMPGSLGLEGFIQLLTVCALQRFGDADCSRVSAGGEQHSWLYRGQVLPSAQVVEWEMQVNQVDEKQRRLSAGGMLWVDGMCIYQVKDFTVALL